MARRLAIVAAGLAAGTALAATAQSQSQSSDSVIVDLGDCVDLESRERQLECYESRVTEVLEEREKAPGASERVPAAASSPPAAPEPSNASREPNREELRSDRRNDERAAATVDEETDDGADEIVATVTQVRELEPNAYLIYLDNDQVWRQNRPKRYPLFAGTEVRLSPTHWGPSYRLTDPEVGSFIQVERVR